MSSTVGLLQYAYNIVLIHREGRGPPPLYMHTSHFVHVPTWAYRRRPVSTPRSQMTGS